jgi:predicted DNA-binding transcriptional regulator AlpA
LSVSQPKILVGGKFMPIAFRNTERARQEIAQLHGELLQLEKRVNSVRESLGKAITDLFGTDRQAFPALAEAALAARVAEAVVSRLSVPTPVPSSRKQYIREREAAEYMGVKVSTLRAWRLLRSKNGPPFTRVGRMILYPVKELEDHMQERIVPRHHNGR